MPPRLSLFRFRFRLLPSIPRSEIRCRPPPTPATFRPFSAAPPLTPDRYHTLANHTLDALFDNLEALAEERTDIDVEYSSGVLTLKHPNGTYVLNKQPPNKQIWLSSPVSGPKRYDWDEARRTWVYARDGGTLAELVEGEVGVGVGVGEEP